MLPKEPWKRILVIIAYVAIGLVAAMAKAMVDSEYKPLNDIIFIT